MMFRRDGSLDVRVLGARVAAFLCVAAAAAAVGALIALAGS